MNIPLRLCTLTLCLLAAALATMAGGAQAASQQIDMEHSGAPHFIPDEPQGQYTPEQAYSEVLSWASGSSDQQYLAELYETIELNSYRYSIVPEFALAVIAAEARYGAQISWARQNTWMTFEELSGKKMSRTPAVLDDVQNALSELSFIMKQSKTMDEVFAVYWSGPEGNFNKGSLADFSEAVSKLWNGLEPFASARDAKQDGKRYKQNGGNSGGGSDSHWGRLAVGDLEGYSSKLNSMPKLASQLESFGKHDEEYARIAKHFNKKLSDGEAIVIARAVLTYCKKTDNIVDPRLVMSVVAAESAFKPQAVSKAGAMGLGQLMPSTAKGLGVKDAFDPIQNLYGCVKYLEREVVRWGSKPDALDRVLASYNAGPGAVKKYNGVPPYKETKNYVKTVKGYYRQLTGGGK